jgi:hemoglobin/transferrin/lactoferrin receptor protein
MNNLIYRTGHLQNSITIDKNMLDYTDVLFGPSSTIYGSDALGGAIYFKTKDAKTLDNTNNKSLSGTVKTSYNTVNDGKATHLSINNAHKNWASLTAFSFNDYGDLKMGQTPNGNNPHFGERPFYIQTINNIDTQVANENRFIQKFSAYKQYDFMQKLLFNQANGYKHLINLQYSTTTDIPRYDRLTDLNNAGKLKTAVWNYGPQKRLLTAYTVTKNNVFLNTDMKLSSSYQNLEESRITRNVGNANQGTRIEKIEVFGFNSDFKTKINAADFIYGLDIYYDQLQSTAFNTNIFSNATTPLDSRYPDGKNNTMSLETFASYNNKFNDKTAYNVSIRTGYKELNSQMATNFLNLPYTTVNQKNFTYSAAMGLTNNPSQKIKLAFNLASAFRVPNIEDVAKIFESTADAIIVPNNDLKPEKTITADLGITIWEGKTFQFENNFFVTKMYDPIVTDKFVLNGQSTLFYNGTNSNILANQNQGRADIVGLSSNIKTYITKHILLTATVNIIKGTVENNYRSVPLDHIAPVYGKIGFKYEKAKLNIDLYMLYNGAKKLESYSPSGEDNLNYAPIGGTPSWETYNLKASYSFHPITVFAGIENILDTQYRTFASGMNAPGRNTYLSVKFSF